jgi:hypothetical protein
MCYWHWIFICKWFHYYKTASGASQDITDYGDWKIQNLIAKYNIDKCITDQILKKL